MRGFHPNSTAALTRVTHRNVVYIDSTPWRGRREQGTHGDRGDTRRRGQWTSGPPVSGSSGGGSYRLGPRPPGGNATAMSFVGSSASRGGGKQGPLRPTLACFTLVRPDDQLSIVVGNPLWGCWRSVLSESLPVVCDALAAVVGCGPPSKQPNGVAEAPPDDCSMQE